MAKVNELLIKKNYTKLLEINAQEIIDHLYQDDIIKYNEKQLIETQVVDKEKARKLLDLMIQKGEKAATCFLEILKNCDSYRYQDILQTNSDNFDLEENSTPTFDSIQETLGDSAPSTQMVNSSAEQLLIDNTVQVKPQSDAVLNKQESNTDDCSKKTGILETAIDNIQSLSLSSSQKTEFGIVAPGEVREEATHCIEELKENNSSIISLSSHQNITLPVAVSANTGDGSNAKDKSKTEGSIQEFFKQSAEKANSCQDLDLLIIGKTGNGKSATANSILLAENNLFETGDSYTSVTQKVQRERRKFRNRLITVVEGPGVGDTSEIENVETATIKVIECMQEVVALNPEGYHAILLVVRYGARFTKEDTECIRILKHIFGHDFIKDFCILLVTHGDQFSKKQKKPFIEWCNEQKEKFSELLFECDKRVVLFDNDTENKWKREEQLIELIGLVDNLQQRRNRYKMSHYILSAENRGLLLAKVKEPKFREKIIQEYTEIMDAQETDLDVTTIDKLKTLLDKILHEYKDTGMLTDIIAVIEMTIESKEALIIAKRNCEMEKEKEIAAEKQKHEMIINEFISTKAKLETEKKEKKELHKKFQQKEQEELLKIEERKRKETENILNQQQHKFKKERDSLLKDKHDVEEQFNTLLENQTLGEKERQKLKEELEKKKNEYLEQLVKIEFRKRQHIGKVKKEASEELERVRESSNLRLQEEEERHVKEMNEANASLQEAENKIKTLTEEYNLKLRQQKVLHEDAMQNLKLTSEKEITELKKKLEMYNKFPYTKCVII